MFPHYCLHLVLFSGRAWRRESCMKKNFFHYLLIISWFLLLIKSFLKNNMQNVWRFQKKPYLCIAFETEVYGRLAQLVQSIWFTPRGSGVRIPQRPQKRFKKDLFLHLSTFSRAPNICKYPIYNFGSYIRFCCELLTPACKKVYLPFVIKWIRD